MLNTWSLLLEREHGTDIQPVLLLESKYGSDMQVFGLLKFDTDLMCPICIGKCRTNISRWEEWTREFWEEECKSWWVSWTRWRNHLFRCPLYLLCYYWCEWLNNKENSLPLNICIKSLHMFSCHHDYTNGAVIDVID